MPPSSTDGAYTNVFVFHLWEGCNEFTDKASHDYKPLNQQEKEKEKGKKEKTKKNEHEDEHE